MPNEVTIEFDPPDLIQRMQQYPTALDYEMRDMMNKSMLHIQGSVPSYPQGPPGVDTSQRTGTLGRSLTIQGQGNIRRVRKQGRGAYVGEFGTRVFYAPDVIGDGTQGVPWSRYWWTMRTVLRRAIPGMQRLANVTAEKMARYLDGR